MVRRWRRTSPPGEAEEALRTPAKVQIIQKTPEKSGAMTVTGEVSALSVLAEQFVAAGLPEADWERLNAAPTRQLRPATAGSKGAYYRSPRPGTSRPVIPREGPPDPTLVIATYNSISGKQPYVCGRGKHGTFPPSLTPPS